MDNTLLYIKCDDVPSSMTIGKKKYYLTNNIFYGGVHWAIRKKLVELCKFYLIGKMKKKVSIKEDQFPVEIEIVYHSPKHTFDIDNKAGYWLKVLLDLIKQNGTVPDDNVKFVSSIKSSYVRLPLKENDILEIFITQHSRP
jgi:hypothetical protein